MWLEGKASCSVRYYLPKLIFCDSDTTAATLTTLFFELAKKPELQRTLQSELDALSNLSTDQLTGLKYLDAIINETLRLHPVVPSGLQRQTPPEGLQIGETYIPGNVMVAMPMHALFRGIVTWHSHRFHC